MKTAKVENGFVQGKVKEVLGKEIVQFLCIPYCKAPLNKLRFQRSQNIDHFSENVINKLEFETCFPQTSLRIFDGTNEGEERWIPKHAHDEDSLYLNIWCPLDVFNGKVQKPVLVWIHGGGFMTGSSSMPIYDGSVLSSQENIIVVNINYRLGIFGYLYLNHELANGNQGLWDQVLALQWIHRNITVFNGDSNNITICGNSAGGCSVSFHLLIKESWGTFNKAIMHSGVCTIDWSLLPKEEVFRRSETLVNRLLERLKYPLKWNEQISSDDKKSIIEYLQSLNFKDIILDSELYAGMYQLAWSPIIDGELIKDNPRDMFLREEYKICPTIFLHSKNEGDMFILYEFPKIQPDNEGMIDVTYLDHILKYYPYYPLICEPSVKELIKKKYNVNGTKVSIKKVDEIISDQHIICDTIDLANIVSRSNKEVYYLIFNALFPNDYWPPWCGVLHGDEIFCLFGNSLVNGYKTECEKKTSIEFMKNYGNFITNG